MPDRPRCQRRGSTAGRRVGLGRSWLWLRAREGEGQGRLRPPAVAASVHTWSNGACSEDTQSTAALVAARQRATVSQPHVTREEQGEGYRLRPVVLEICCGSDPAIAARQLLHSTRSTHRGPTQCVATAVGWLVVLDGRAPSPSRVHSAVRASFSVVVKLHAQMLITMKLLQME